MTASNSQLPDSSFGICLTDAPRVVALKRVFFALDEESEVCKTVRDGLTSSPNAKARAQARLQVLLNEKAAIGAEIFGAGRPAVLTAENAEIF